MTKIQEKQTNRRREIIETIIPLLEEKTFEEISVEDICKAADISVGSFYHYFEKKSDILAGLFTRIDSFMEKDVYPLLKKRDEIENLRIFAQSWIKYIEGTGLDHSRLIATIDTTDLTLSGEKRSSAAVLEKIIQRGQEKGQITASQSPQQLAELFMIALRGLSKDWTSRGAAYSLTGRGTVYIEFMLKALEADSPK